MLPPRLKSCWKFWVIPSWTRFLVYLYLSHFENFWKSEGSNLYLKYYKWFTQSYSLLPDLLINAWTSSIITLSLSPLKKSSRPSISSSKVMLSLQEDIISRVYNLTFLNQVSTVYWLIRTWINPIPTHRSTLVCSGSVVCTVVISPIVHTALFLL